jgi:hypothetical protein
MRKLSIFGTTIAALTACGQLTVNGVEKQDKPSEVEGKIKILRGPGLTEPIAISYEPASGCTKSKEGMLRVELTQKVQQGLQSVNVGISIKGITSKPQEYTCTQSADNNGKNGAVGNIFDQCTTELLVSNQSKADSFDIYTIARSQPEVGPLKYSENCYVKITELLPAIAGTFSCEEMIKTHSAGTPIALPDIKNTTDISGRFSCTIEK